MNNKFAGPVASAVGAALVLSEFHGHQTPHPHMPMPLGPLPVWGAQSMVLTTSTGVGYSFNVHPPIK